MTILRLFGAAAGAALFAAPSIAQTDVESREVIIVTATRAPLNVDRAATRVDVIDRSAIEANGLVTLVDALKDLPGLTVVQSGPAGSTASLFFRGTNSSHALMLFDGVRINDPAAPSGQFDFGQDGLGDVERVEVVRGPLSSLYGSEAIGGVVNIIPRLGGDRPFELFFEAEGGSFDTARGLVGAAGSTARLRYGVTVEQFVTGGFDVMPERFSTRTGDRDGSSTTTATAAARFALAGGLALEGILRRREAASEFDTFSGGSTGFQRADDPDLETDEDDMTLWRGGLALEERGFESRLRAGQVLRDRESTDGDSVAESFDGDRAFAEWLNVWRPDAVELAPLVSFGLQYERDAIETVPAFADPVDIAEERRSGYAGVTARFAGRLETAASVRVDDYEAFGTKTTYNIGGVLDLGQTGLQLAGSYGTSFRAPSLTERFSTSLFNIGNPGLDPEVGESWEFSVRGARALWGRPEAVSAGVVAFDTSVDDLIEYDFARLQNVNVGRAEIDGYEAWFEIAPRDRLSGRLEYAYTDARNSLTGARLLRRPAHAWSAEVRVEPHARLALSARWSYVGARPDVNYDDDGFFVSSGGLIEAHDLVALSIVYEAREGISLFIGATNLLDESYEQPEAYRGAPRAVTVGLRGSF
jgi:vitamin B12 transporter